MTNIYKKLAFVAAGTFLSVAALDIKSAQAAFSGFYAPSNFTLTNTNANGFVDITGAPSSVTLTGGNNLSGTFGTTDYTTTAFGDGQVSFDWDYLSFNASPEFDPFGFLLNGDFTQLTDNNGLLSQFDGFTTSVQEGDIFGWRIATIDNGFGAAQTTISNFDAPAPEFFDYISMEVPFQFEDISETGTRVLAGADDATASAALGFTFDFFGTDYTDVSWSPNGLMTFGGTNGQFSNVDLTTTAPFGDFPSIAPLWDDWQFFSEGTDATYFQTLGTPGDRRFVLQWNIAEGFSDSPSPVTFQSTLFEGSNEILFSYLDVDSGDFRAFGSDGTVGIRNSGGEATGEVEQFSFNTPALRNEQSILFKQVKPTPEPNSVLGLLVLGFLGMKSRLKRQK
ncbi:MAG: hypothetical protein QNJ41_20040 [Xenococcaceae cyanobacterium MO_188.B32]|nr:hypothetical protein [Xenococcaceae cyanobacterium MO_188.B32]